MSIAPFFSNEKNNGYQAQKYENKISYDFCSAIKQKRNIAETNENIRIIIRCVSQLLGLHEPSTTRDR
jgi:hypothetical protein